MANRRDSRPDTLNQLVSPQSQFALEAKPGFTQVNQRELLMSSPSSGGGPATGELSRAKSANVIGRRVTMKNQGGGFNRTLNSGYFKGKGAKGKQTADKTLHPSRQVNSERQLDYPSATQVFV